MEKLSKLILGTVQFGLKYGINNATGKPGTKEVFEMLRMAKNNTIKMLDTAETYGNAIEVIGNYQQENSDQFQIISKFKAWKTHYRRLCEYIFGAIALCALYQG